MGDPHPFTHHDPALGSMTLYVNKSSVNMDTGLSVMPCSEIKELRVFKTSKEREPVNTFFNRKFVKSVEHSARGRKPSTYIWLTTTRLPNFTATSVQQASSAANNMMTI